MANYIVKPDPDEDFYVWWSDNVDNAIAYGPRNDEEDPARFDRADREGSSALFGAPGDRAYGWNDEDFILENEESLYDDPRSAEGYWTLARKHLKEFCLRGEGADIADLVTFHPYSEDD